MMDTTDADDDTVRLDTLAAMLADPAMMGWVLILLAGI